jgi:multidrug efflux system membrane fusion protein
VVPIAAILPGEEGGTACLVITADNIAHRRSVKLGVREGDKVQILNGVRPGEEVVIVGGIGLDDKAKVKVIDTSVKEAADEDQNAPPEPAAGKDQKKDAAKPKSK